jgi:hypothetical protein
VTKDGPEATAMRRDRWSTLARATGVTAIVAVVLLFGPIIALSSAGEPPFDATQDEAATFFRNADVAWADAAEAIAAVGMLAVLWFVVGLTTLLRRVEGEPAWRSTVALVSGTLVAAYGVLDASWDAAANRGTELDPGVALHAFDVGNLGFANEPGSCVLRSVFIGWRTGRRRTARPWRSALAEMCSR